MTKRLLFAACLLAQLPSCCPGRERELRNALQPYVQAMRAQFAATGTCPISLDGLGVAANPGLHQHGNELSGFGGTAHYLYNRDGTCGIAYSGFSFCGLCRSESSAPQWQCYH